MKFVVTLTIALMCFASEVLGDTICWNDTIYEDLGCFSNDPPCDNTNFLPDHPGDINTGFWLYTKQNPDVYDVVSRYDPPSLTNSNFDKDRNSKFLTHGWVGSGEEEWVITMKNEFINSTEDLNVFVVDWEDGAAAIYERSVANTDVVGAEIDAFVQFLVAAVGYTEDKIHLIGHSLGSHISGHAGKRMESLSRISGLDPAGPNFQGTDPYCKLDATDAKFVDAIHSDGDNLGMLEVSGHADFYPNGGASQPGCNIDNCDHHRACDLYSASIYKCVFEAYPCEDLANWQSCTTCGTGCNTMGYYVDVFTHGTFTLSTSDIPFC